jgi:hypothetical protein
MIAAQNESFAVKWMVKPFKNIYAYRDAQEGWHDKPGFECRYFGSYKRVKVFAELSVVTRSKLDGFQEPDESLFSPHGTPGGWPIPEADLRPSAGGNCGRQR